MKGVDKACTQVRDQDHIPSLYMLEPHTGTVKTHAFRHHQRGKLAGGQGEVVQMPPQVAVEQIDEFNALLFYVLSCISKLIKHEFSPFYY